MGKSIRSKIKRKWRAKKRLEANGPFEAKLRFEASWRLQKHLIKQNGIDNVCYLRLVLMIPMTVPLRVSETMGHLFYDKNLTFVAFQHMAFSCLLCRAIFDSSPQSVDRQHSCYW